MKVPLFTFASHENQLIAAMIIYLGQSRSRVIAPTYHVAKLPARTSWCNCRFAKATGAAEHGSGALWVMPIEGGFAPQ